MCVCVCVYFIICRAPSSTRDVTGHSKCVKKGKKKKRKESLTNTEMKIIHARTGIVSAQDTIFDIHSTLFHVNTSAYIYGLCAHTHTHTSL